MQSKKFILYYASYPKNTKHIQTPINQHLFLAYIIHYCFYFILTSTYCHLMLNLINKIIFDTNKLEYKAFIYKKEKRS